MYTRVGSEFVGQGASLGDNDRMADLSLAILGISFQVADVLRSLKAREVKIRRYQCKVTTL